jgi:nicotinamidase-related amidase
LKRFDGQVLPETLAEHVAPERAALIIYDMQVGICRQVDSAAVTGKIARLRAAARAAGVRVAYTRHLSLPKRWMGASALRMAMAWQRKDDPADVAPWFLRGSDGVEVVPELAPQDDEAVFDKLTMSAFEGTALARCLRDCGLATAIFAGIALEVGIDPSVRHGADLGFTPVIVEDACGCGDAAAAARALEAIRYAGDTIVTDTQTLIAAWSG